MSPYPLGHIPRFDGCFLHKRDSPFHLLQHVVISSCLLSPSVRDYILAHAGEARYACGPADLTMSDYFAYADATKEERPLYLFDKHFAAKVSPVLY